MNSVVESNQTIIISLSYPLGLLSFGPITSIRRPSLFFEQHRCWQLCLGMAQMSSSGPPDGNKDEHVEKLLAEGLKVLQNLKDEKSKKDKTVPKHGANDDDPAVVAWKQAILGGMNNRHKEGQRFDRASDGGRSEAFKKLGNNKSRTDFKVAWGKAQLEAFIYYIKFRLFIIMLCSYYII